MTTIDLERVREKRQLQPAATASAETWREYRELIERLDDPRDGDEDRLIELLLELDKTEADVPFDREVLATHARLTAEYSRVAGAEVDRKTIDAEITRLVAEHEATLQKLRKIEQQLKAQRARIEPVDGDVMMASDRRYRLNLLAWEFAALLGIPRPAHEPNPANPGYTASGELTNAFLRRRQQLAEHDPARLSPAERAQAQHVDTFNRRQKAGNEANALNREVRERNDAARPKPIPVGTLTQQSFGRDGRPAGDPQPHGPKPAEPATAAANE